MTPIVSAENPKAIQTAENYFAERRGLGDKAAALAFLSRPGGQPPQAGDEIPRG